MVEGEEWGGGAGAIKRKDRRIEVFCGRVSVQVRERYKTREKKNPSSERNHRKSGEFPRRRAEREELCCEIKMSNLKKKKGDRWIHSRHKRSHYCGKDETHTHITTNALIICGLKSD